VITSMPNIPGLDELRSIKGTHPRSVPPHMNQPYIDMFMLNKEKERLEKEGARLNIKIESVVGRLREIEKEIERLRREDKKVQKKKKFNWDEIWMKIKGETDPEESDNRKIETGWKIKTLNRKR
jgi:predicted nuclease with TOPRIM domain